MSEVVGGCSVLRKTKWGLKLCAGLCGEIGKFETNLPTTVHICYGRMDVILLHYRYDAPSGSVTTKDSPQPTHEGSLFARYKWSPPISLLQSIPAC